MSTLQEQLYDKVSAEYNDFIDKIITLPPKEIIEKSYEKVFKEDIRYALADLTLSNEQAEALLNLDYPLDALYNKWLDTDVSYMEDLSYIIENFAKNEASLNKELTPDDFIINELCAKDLVKAISQNYDLNGYTLNTQKVLEVLTDKYSMDKVKLALAAHISQFAYDGRIPQSTKEWAKEYILKYIDASDTPRLTELHSSTAALNAVNVGIVNLVAERALKPERSQQVTTKFIGEYLVEQEKDLGNGDSLCLCVNMQNAAAPYMVCKSKYNSVFKTNMPTAVFTAKSHSEAKASFEIRSKNAEKGTRQKESELEM